MALKVMKSPSHHRNAPKMSSWRKRGSYLLERRFSLILSSSARLKPTAWLFKSLVLRIHILILPFIQPPTRRTLGQAIEEITREEICTPR